MIDLRAADVTCSIDIEENNLRQLCGKTHCSNKAYIAANDIYVGDGDDGQPAQKTFLSKIEFDNLWLTDPYQRWYNLLCNEIFYVLSTAQKCR